MLKYAFELSTLSYGIFHSNTEEHNIIYVSHFLYIKLKFSKPVYLDGFYNMYSVFLSKIYFLDKGKINILLGKFIAQLFLQNIANPR